MNVHVCGSVLSACFLVLVCMMGWSRGQNQIYTVDSLVVMDTPAFFKWVNREPNSLTLEQKQDAAREKIQEYISLVIRQANLRLETLTEDTGTDWSIRLSIAQFSIGVDPLQGSANLATNTISHQTAIDTLRLWVVAQGYNNNFDYVILLTGYNLQGTSSQDYDIKGIANIGSMCNKDGTSVTVVEDRGGFQSEYFVAHEMGHSLGSLHDGESPNTACPNSERYIMARQPSAVTSSNRLHPWQWSTCSKKTIGDYMLQNILEQHPSCLNTSVTPAVPFINTENVLPGQVYDVRAQCQNMYGSQSTVCLGDNFKLGDVCTSMYCLDTSHNLADDLRCVQHVAASGSSCGDGKICQRGQCVTSPLAPDTKFSDCYFGDATVTIDGGFTCSQYVPQRPQICYQASILSACCDSCQNAASSSQACPYGDRKDGCSADFCQLIEVDGTRFEEICCETCGYDVIKACDDVTSIDGMTCSERVNKDGLQSCYDTSVAYHCCKTCAGLRKNVTGCEYGDRTTDNSCQRLVRDEASCQQYRSQCCHTCANLNDPDGAERALGSSSTVVLVAVVILSKIVTWL